MPKPTPTPPNNWDSSTNPPLTYPELLSQTITDFTTTLQSLFSSLLKGDLINALLPEPLREILFAGTEDDGFVYDAASSHPTASDPLFGTRNSESPGGPGKEYTQPLGPTSILRSIKETIRSMWWTDSTFTVDDPTSFDRALKGFMKDSRRFVTAIDWSEPLILSMLTFHLLSFLFILWNRNNTTFLSLALFTLAFLPLSAEHINAWASRNHALLASTNYFDKNGLFISTLLSGPVVVNLGLVMMFLLRGVVRLMVDVKKKQLKRGMEKKEAKQEGKKEAKKEGKKTR
ncbi:hypothetical protein HDV05_006394 [Chytridiales sp. JEL 0842]|nr:hypothetical protein HDV05_006394 [Chytridiales sp. JEL 0842]